MLHEMCDVFQEGGETALHLAVELMSEDRTSLYMVDFIVQNSNRLVQMDNLMRV